MPTLFDAMFGPAIGGLSDAVFIPLSNVVGGIVGTVGFGVLCTVSAGICKGPF